MSTQAHDQLYRIFETRLHSGDYDDLPVDNLLLDVVEVYWDELNGDVSVPVRMQVNVKADLIEDLRDMLRIKIYGSHGVGEYNRRRNERK